MDSYLLELPGFEASSFPVTPSAAPDPTEQRLETADRRAQAVYDRRIAAGFVVETVVRCYGLQALRWWEITGGSPDPDQVAEVEEAESRITLKDREKAAQAVSGLLLDLVRISSPDDVAVLRAPMKVANEHGLGNDSYTMAVMLRPPNHTPESQGK